MKAGSASVVDALRCEARGAAIASGSVIPKSMRSSRICRTVVMIVAPPGLPTARNGLPSLEHDRRRHARARPLAAGRAGSGRACRRVGGRGRVEVGQLVVEQEPVVRDGDRAAGDLLDRARVAHDVAARGRRRRGGLWRSPRGQDATEPALEEQVVSYGGLGSPGGTGLDRGRRADQAAALGREALREQPVERDVHVVGVADPAVAVGDRRAASPRGSGAAPARGRGSTCRSPRGCSATRRPSSRRSRAGPCRRRRSRGR